MWTACACWAKKVRMKMTMVDRPRKKYQCSTRIETISSTPMTAIMGLWKRSMQAITKAFHRHSCRRMVRLSARSWIALRTCSVCGICWELVHSVWFSMSKTGWLVRDPLSKLSTKRDCRRGRRKFSKMSPPSCRRWITLQWFLWNEYLKTKSSSFLRWS